MRGGGDEERVDEGAGVFGLQYEYGRGSVQEKFSAEGAGGAESGLGRPGGVEGLVGQGV